MFQFKQFAVDQSNCAMKINTDGVLLGAMPSVVDPKHILDIGTGTGVIALMLAQRFPAAQIEAVEIDDKAAATAVNNFRASPFADRLSCYHSSFENFFTDRPARQYDLIISNPPFYIKSLKSKGAAKAIAKHANENFFTLLLTRAAAHLTNTGALWLILPPETAKLVSNIASGLGLHLIELIEITSYPGSETHRHIVAFSFTEAYLSTHKFNIYREPKIYSELYTNLLKPFFTIF